MYSDLTLFCRLAYIYFDLRDPQWLLRICRQPPILKLARALAVSSAVDLIFLRTLMGIEGLRIVVRKVRQT